MEPLHHKVAASRLLLGLISVVHVILKAVLFILAVIVGLPFVLTFAIMILVLIGWLIVSETKGHYQGKVEEWVDGKAEDIHE